MKLPILACTALIFVMMAACARPPTAEMNNATEAVTRAENDIDAITYAGNSLARARDALTRMQIESASKRYETARSYAAEAIAAAERAISEGRAGAVRARTDASALVKGLEPLVEETGQNIDAGEAARLALDFDAINREYDKASQEAEQAQEALSDSRYQDALKLGQEARSDLVTINQQLSDAAFATSRKK